MGNTFIICVTEGGIRYINVSHIIYFLYDAGSDMTEIYVRGFDRPFACHGDITDDITQKTILL